MLRASTEYNGGSVDVTMLRGTAVDGPSGVPAAGELLAFATAASSGDPHKTAAARDMLSAKLGIEAVVDAAAVIGNFERMTRIADATGIPLDAPVNAVAAQIQQDLGLRDFRSAGATKPAGRVARALAEMFGGVVLQTIPVIARFIRRRSERERA